MWNNEEIAHEVFWILCDQCGNIRADITSLFRLIDPTRLHARTIEIAIGLERHIMNPDGLIPTISTFGSLQKVTP